MKYFILMLALQHALGQCPEWIEHIPDIPCGPDELSCPVPPHPVFPDCQFPNACIPVWNDYGDECPPPACPVMCMEDEIFCPGDWNGMCAPIDTCIQRPSNDCPAFCPITCDPITEEYCPGGINYYDGPEHGCEMPPQCMPKSRDINGIFCPNNCPVMCLPGELMCPGGVDEVGCRTPDTCVPIDPNSNCGDYYQCPINCNPYEYSCPGEIDSDGCQHPGYCMYKEHGYDGGECTPFCPIQCAENEIYCPGSRDANGCSSPDFCNSLAIDENGNICPGFCPMNCGADEMLCPGGNDCDGCPMEPICISVADQCPPPNRSCN